jgi:hypothetical protein
MAAIKKIDLLLPPKHLLAHLMILSKYLSATEIADTTETSYHNYFQQPLLK